MTMFSFAQMVCLVAMCLVASTSAFVVPVPAARASALAAASPSTSRVTLRCRRAGSVLRMSEEEEAVEEVAVEEVADVAGDATKSVQSFFAPNENVRLGSSRDQDGKSNVWAVEPKMRVEGTDVESPEGNKLAVVGGIIGVLVVAMGATIAFLPSPDSL